MFSDITSVALHTTLTGLATRQRVIADNIANVNTPRFLAGRVTFEDALADAVLDADPGQRSISIDRSLEPTREDGNNVNLDHETLASLDTNLRYTLGLRAVDDKFGLISTVIKGGAI